MSSHTNVGVSNGHDTVVAAESPQVAELLTQVLDRLNRLEHKINRVDALLDQAPNMVAIMTDTVDGLYNEATRIGIDPDERVKLGLTLLDKLTEPQTIKALTGLMENLEWIERTVRQAPGMLAMMVDIADEMYAVVDQQGIDLEATVKRALVAFKNFVILLDSKEVRALMESGVLDPQTLTVIGHAASALVKSRNEAHRAGPMALANAPFRWDVQEAIGFALTFAQNFGNNISVERQAAASQ